MPAKIGAIRGLFRIGQKQVRQAILPSAIRNYVLQFSVFPVFCGLAKDRENLKAPTQGFTHRQYR